MKTILIFIFAIALTAKLGATSIAPRDNHDVASTNGKFKLHVDAKSETHKITGAFGAGMAPWIFKHEVSNHDFFVSDDGEAAAVVHWSWVQDYRLDEPAVVIYGRDGAKRSYTYKELSRPRERKPDTIGPIGDFWRIWRGDANIEGNVLTIHVEGGKPRIIDLKNAQPMPPLDGNPSKKAEDAEHPNTRKDREAMLRAREGSPTDNSTPPDDAQPVPDPAQNDWTKADKMMAEHLKKVDPNMRSAVFDSDLLRKYLPDFRVHVRYDRHVVSETRIFVVNRQGEITPLPDEGWSRKAGEKFDRSPNIAGFLARQKIQVKNAEDAVEVAKLFEEMQDAANYVASLNINTKDFTLFDKAFIEGCYGPTQWKHSAIKSKDGWAVKVKYIGPPEASIMMPPTYEMFLDEQQMFQDLRSY